MKYRNIKTGAVIDSSSIIGGENWVPVIEEKKAVEPVIEIVENPVKTIDEMTKKEIMAELDSMGVEYNPRANKTELYNLMR
jgi:hypothetical protein